ncbi:MAG: 50S ribosomal protein L24 [Deltaproteobacteria bacterium]|jgi:large subunit ribosomal protein L24|nr:50S ribosomal protein L24 [Deltaproteobacteria bacterium]
MARNILKKEEKAKELVSTKLKKGDRLQLLTGKNVKAIGVLKELKLSKSQVLVEGLNINIKHQKANPQYDIKGGRISKEGPIHISNVALVCPKCMKPTRVGHKILEPQEEGAKKRKVRICRRCLAQIDD